MSAEMFRKIQEFVTATGYRSMSGFIEDVVSVKLGLEPVKVNPQHAKKFRIQSEKTDASITENSHLPAPAEELNKFTVHPPQQAKTPEQVAKQIFTF